MPWAKPEYSRQRVNAAGKILVIDPWRLEAGHIFKAMQKEEEALQIINNWRAAHSYPLNTFQVTLRNKSKGIDEKTLVAQRIKRLSSINSKLRRFPKMKLTQMQDIGGCRAIVGSVASVSKLVELYHESRIKHELAAKDDYISNPRHSGYRGVHLIYRYFSDRSATEIYNDLKIEMQLRSRYQHAWATAVETVGTFVQQALKSSIGEHEWLRFFALMGTQIAIREKCPSVPGTPTNRKELLDELQHYARVLDVGKRLRAYQEALQYLEPLGPVNAHFYLLELDSVGQSITVTGFKYSELEEASRQYLEVEKEVREKQGADAVLVSVESLASLRRAYPNYFADTRIFVTLLDRALIDQ